jgi:hypothetical protein
MTVYLVSKYYDCEGHEADRVFASVELAKEYVESATDCHDRMSTSWGEHSPGEWRAGRGQHRDGWLIQAMEVTGIADAPIT